MNPAPLLACKNSGVGCIMMRKHSFLLLFFFRGKVQVEHDDGLRRRSEGVHGMAFWGGGEGGMNHGPQDGNKVHFLSRQTISQEIWPTPPPPPDPPISICMEAALLSPEVARGQREVLPFKRRHLSQPVFSILKEDGGGGAAAPALLTLHHSG